MPSLFEPFTLGDLELKNRVIMAPLTRSRASADGVHGELAQTYYRQRAGAGLIITEATAVSKQGSGYVNIPGIWNDAQVKGWQGVTKTVHDAGGKIFLQMFHTGRVGHSSLYGEQPVAPTTKPPQGQVMGADYAMHEYETPRMLKTEEIPGLIAQFTKGAGNAKKAGFDGVEIHAANGYILDQFLRSGVNERTDHYGGSLENRLRLLRDVVEAAVKIWGPGRVGVRLSPANPFNSMSDANPVETFTGAAKMLNAFPLAYLHVTESPENGVRRVAAEIRKIYKGTLIVNGGLDNAAAKKMIEAGEADLACFGSLYISNPDLVERLKANAPLAKPDSSTFYGGDAKGYTDYPALQKDAA